MLPYEDPLHDLPDRAFRRLLEEPQNLQNLLAEVVPDLVERLDFERREIVPRTFLLDDWRRREADMLFRLPFREDPTAPGTLIYILLEHQSESDPAMPLRVLLYAVLHWQEEWKAWEAAHPHGEPLRLRPIIPIVFHTGQDQWRTHRTMADLIGASEALRGFAPEWQSLFWDLAERTTEELVQAAGELLVALAVVRAERADEATFRSVFDAALRRLEALSETERVRWHELLWFALSWALRRRPGQEREALMQTPGESTRGGAPGGDTANERNDCGDMGTGIGGARPDARRGPRRVESPSRRSARAAGRAVRAAAGAAGRTDRDH